MRYRVVDLRSGQEHVAPTEDALWRLAQARWPWAMDPAPASAVELAARLDHAQALSVEAEPEGPSPAPEAAPVPAGDPWRAAALLAGLAQPDLAEAHAQARVLHEGEPSAAACAAAGLDPADPEVRRSVRQLAGLMSPEPMGKAEDGPAVPQATPVRPVTPGSEDIAAALQQTVSDGSIGAFEAAGKHSKGMLIANTSLGPVLVKPGSGPASPCKGVDEQPASQAQREASTWRGLTALGLGTFAVRAEVVQLGEAPVAAIQFLPQGEDGFQPLGKALRKDPGGTQLRLLPLLASGALHRLALALAVLGEPDSHDGNSLTSAEDSLRLIDHGSALAGRSFDPATDPAAFCPAFLRAWTTPGWARLAPHDRLAALPRLSLTAEGAVRGWLAGVDGGALAGALGAVAGVDPSACVARLQVLKAALTTTRADVVCNTFWAVGKTALATP